MAGGAYRQAIGANAGGTIAQWDIVAITTAVDGQLTVVTSTTATDVTHGIAEHAAVAGDHVTVVVGGETFVKAGETLAAGDFVNSGAAGDAFTPANTTLANPCIGFVLEAGVVGDIIKVFVTPGASRANTA